MSRPDGSSVATNALREYATFLAGDGSMEQVWRQVHGPVRPPEAPSEGGDNCAERIRALIAKLEEGKVPVEAWGAPGAHVSPVGPSGNEYILHDGPAPDHYMAFKNAYETAHKAMIDRLNSLAEVYESAAEAYRATADAYDELHGTDQ